MTPGSRLWPGSARHGWLRVRSGRLRRLREVLQRGPAGIVTLAVVTGFGAGLGAIAFRWLIGEFTLLFTGQSDYGSLDRPVNPVFGIWFIIAVPALGGLIYGPLIDRFAREARGHGVPEVMFAVAERGGRIRPRVAIIKSLASAICLGSGGSVGREGPIVQIGSALGSALGQALRVGEGSLRLLVACGAAGGISATFNAPIAGVFFALELILRDFEVRSFGAVVLASVTADVVSRAAFGASSFLPLPPFTIVSLGEYPLYAVLGLIAALVGVGFIRILYGMEDLIDRLLIPRPEWLRPVVGGLLLGVLLLALPQLYGVGYAPMEQAIGGNMSLQLLLLLLVGKLVATSLTIGIGGSGGVFAPSLFMGGMLGTAFGIVANAAFPGAVAPAGAYGLVGMGAVFASAAHAPITSVLILFELTGDYQVILPMMTAIAVSAGLSSQLSRDTIYTLKLRRRGIDVLRGRGASLMGLLTAADAMRPVPVPLPSTATLTEVVDRLVLEGVEALPVVRDDGTYAGIVTTDGAEEHMRANELDATAADLTQLVPAVRATETLEQVLERLLAHGAAGLPVLSADDGRVIGWLTHRDLLRAYSTAEVAAADSGDRRGDQSGGRLRAVPVEAGTGSQAPTGSAGTRRGPGQAGPSWLSDFRIVDLAFTSDRPPVGSRLVELPWPALALPILVRREGLSFAPTDSTVLLPGDAVTVLVVRELAGGLADRIAVPEPADAASEAPPPGDGDAAHLDPGNGPDDVDAGETVDQPAAGRRSDADVDANLPVIAEMVAGDGAAEDGPPR
jgi:CIC family chloride channel protein